MYYDLSVQPCKGEHLVAYPCCELRNRRLAWLDEELCSKPRTWNFVLADIEAEKVETLVNVNDVGLLRREFQTTQREPRFEFIDYPFSVLLALAEDYEVVRVAYERPFVLPIRAALVPSSNVESFFQTMQSDVGQQRADHATLRRALFACRPASVLNYSGLQPLPLTRERARARSLV